MTANPACENPAKSPIGDYTEYVHNNPFMEYCHIKINYALPDGRSEISVALEPELLNLNGTIHGGMLYMLADCSAGIAARSDGNGYVTQSSHINFLRSTKCGIVRAESEIVKRGKHITVVRVLIFDESDRLLADCSVDLVKLEK